ncbi:uncharacterized protein LOC133905727 [Phragmites australis]|uniref:uncharacterized protein LOC133905727 n=1 Tax=Phragmites australis TaxID=29695 RepID=UPI002D7A061C|nr:uncharacterized protein LOC133905727 [Phragmites australis]
MYDAEAAKQHGGVAVAGDKICKGVLCFKHAFLIITAVTFAGALVSLVLVWRTRGFYKGDIYAKFKMAPATVADGSNGGVKTVMGTEACAALAEEEEKSKNKKETVNEDLH